VLTSEPAYAATAVEALAALGVALSLDDFGTGYSSLVRLKRLPVSEVKIDSSFISRLLESADDEVIVQSIVDLVRALDIDSVAEGVESAEVAAALRSWAARPRRAGTSASRSTRRRPRRGWSSTAWRAHPRRRCRPATRPRACRAPARPRRRRACRRYRYRGSQLVTHRAARFPGPGKTAVPSQRFNACGAALRGR